MMTKKNLLEAFATRRAGAVGNYCLSRGQKAARNFCRRKAARGNPGSQPPGEPGASEDGAATEGVGNSSFSSFAWSLATNSSARGQGKQAGCRQGSTGICTFSWFRHGRNFAAENQTWASFPGAFHPLPLLPPCSRGPRWPAKSPQLSSWTPHF